MNVLDRWVQHWRDLRDHSHHARRSEEILDHLEQQDDEARRHAEYAAQTVRANHLAPLIRDAIKGGSR